MSDNDSRTTVIIGVGPGLGMSVARRFGRDGDRLVLVSRKADRQVGYLAELAELGVEAEAHAVDVSDPDAFAAVLDTVLDRHRRVDTLYFGAAGADFSRPPVHITRITPEHVTAAFAMINPAVAAVSRVLPGMTERGSGAILLAGGLSGLRAMPDLGQLALASAAIRNYAITLHAALAEHGVYAGTFTIGGLIERGDIHAAVTGNPEAFGGDAAAHTIDPDDIAEVAWQRARHGGPAEQVFLAD